ncbi:phosphotransferase family protein (plasmid) [Sphingomonas paeninsulae]|uniref:Phosphotransferase family protein n=1 Tax=Sphingomonas paeninsulae TaxID=2319844 RepID=A0A494TDC1_SPHPE|nr:phosphotransferase family protein [Sphingomonas paeninsulae]AYJ85063.1 phosphotransferase family protein [Sphingomonas paeninsulae]
MSELAALLPPGLFDAVEAAAGVAVTAVRPRGGGGASREGAELTLVWPDGRTADAYMNYDVHRAGAGDDAAFLREAAILRALSGPFAGSGVQTARFIASIPDLRALVAEKVSGESNFQMLKGDPVRRDAVAADFMTQLAALHRVDPNGVEGVPAPPSVRGEILIRIAAIRESNEASNNPVVRLAADWLEANIPPEPTRMVVVHGDAGPANFLFDGDKVTALLDWELVHIGDPMADMAMIALRMLFQPFVPLPQVFAAYEAAGGVKVDVARVRYWRLLFQAGFASRSRLDDPTAPPPPNLGMNMVYSMVHRRVLAEALAEASGVTLSPVAMPDAPEGPHARSFAIALDDIRDMIVPRIADQQAAVKAKGLARLVKWWRDIERFGPGFAAVEIAELSAALGKPFATLTQARAALGAAVVAGAIDQPTAIRLCHAGVARDSALMADAMGGLAKARFAPLE